MPATPITIEWDQVIGSERMLAVRENGYDVRCGLVSGLDSTSTLSYKALTDAMIADGTITYDHPDTRLSTYKLRYVIARGSDESPQMARVWARYEPPNFSGSPVNKLAIQVGGVQQFYNTERHPSAGKPLRVKLPSDTPETTPAVSTLDTADADVSVQSLPYSRITKVINLFGLFAEVPPGLQDIENKVNHASWPTSSDTSITSGGVVSTPIGIDSRPKGYWKAGVPDISWSQRDGLYAVSLNIASQGDRQGDDWSSYKFAVDPSTGRLLSPTDDLMAALVAQPYVFDIQNNVGGVLKAGMYDLANFGAILGPLINHSPLRSSAAVGILNGV